MNTKSKILSVFLLAIMVIGLTGCNSSTNNDTDSKDNKVPTANTPKEFSGYTVGSPTTDGIIEDGMIIVKKNNYYGVIDLKGNIIVDCDKYTYMDDFSNGMALVTVNDKYGFIDTKGKLVIPLEYDDPYGGPDVFSKTDDVAWVKKDGKWGIVNKKGEVVKEPTLDYSNVYQFKNGYATVYKYGDKCVDTKGNEVDYNTYCANNNIEEVFPKIKGVKNDEGLWGFQDEDGNLIIDYKYKARGSFNEGVAQATLPDDTVEIINEKGEALLIFKKEV